MTPCGAVVCTGCATCVRAWSTATGIRLAPWQKALVLQMFPPPDPVLDRLVARRPDLTPSSAYPGLVIRAGHLESA